MYARLLLSLFFEKMASRFNVSGVFDLLEDDDFGLSGGVILKAMGSVATFLRWTRVFVLTFKPGRGGVTPLTSTSRPQLLSEAG